MKFPVFELAKVLSFRTHTNRGTHADAKAKILKSAWCEDGERNQLALVLSNDYLVLRYCNGQEHPAVRQIPWPCKDQVSALCFDGRATWLLAVTRHSVIYIIPALAIMDLNAQIEQLWNLNDTTAISITTKSGPPTSVVWWQTLLGQHIAIVGTRLGQVIFVDLLSKESVFTAEVKGRISELHLVKDDSQTITYLLVSNKGGNYWKILLEKQDHNHMWSTDDELRGLGYHQIDSSHIPISCILNQLTGLPEDVADRDEFKPVCFYKFPLSVQLIPQYARGRHFVTSYNKVKKTFEVYDSSLQHKPLFVYDIPRNAEDVFLTNRLIMCTVKRDDSQFKLMFMSNQMAEKSVQQNQTFNIESVIQEFVLRNSVLVGIHKKSLPFYWFEKKEEQDRAGRTDGDMIPISMHTVLDGCILITETEVYECRPRVSPERLFLDLCLNQSNLSHSEQLGIMLGLDVNGLYEQAALFKLERNDFTQAMRLFKLSKCPHSKRVAIMAKYGYVAELTTHLQTVLHNVNLDLATAEAKTLADFALHCFVYSIEKKPEDAGTKQMLRDFLLKFFTYDEKVAIQLLLDHHLMEELFKLAKARGPGMMIEVMEALLKKGNISLSKVHVDSLVEKRMAMPLIRIGEGSFLRCMDPRDLVRFMINQPQLAAEFTPTLNHHIKSYDIDTLLQLCQVFDPSNSLVQMYLHKAESGNKSRNLSISSLSSLSSVMSEDVLSSNQESYCDKAKQLIQFFFDIALQLHTKRGDSALDPMYQKKTPSNAQEPTQEVSYRRGKTYSHLVMPVVIGCGHSHSALIRNGDLYTWGKTKDGRLGHGHIASEHIMYPPCKVETLHMLQIKVLSISCGAKHTLALTQQGVYGWGSSTYGQVGVADTVMRPKPMLLEALTTVPVISVICGQYHSLVLAADSSVYSWGWGVFGQLGHSSVEDVHTPTRIEGLKGLNIIQIQGGYAHTLVLTASGEIYTFGNNTFGQLGEGKTFKITVPKRLDALTEPVTMIASKYFCSYALTNRYQLYMFGCSPLHVRQNMQLSKLNQHKQEPDFYLHPYIFNLEGLEGKIVQISAGTTHVAILTAEGQVYTCGKNFDGQLGIGSNREYPNLTIVSSLKDSSIKFVCCGSNHTIAVDKEGNVFACGRNEFAQLGISEKAGLENIKKMDNMGPQMIPLKLTWVPPAAGLQFDNKHMRRGSDDFWLSDGSIDGEEMGMVGNLPDLSTVTDLPYSVHVITTVVQHLPDYCSLTKLSRQCISDELWGIVADIYETQQLYAQCLQFKLRELKSHQGAFENKQNILDAAKQTLFKYLSKIQQTTLISEYHSTHHEQLLRDTFQFWYDLEFPFVTLEEILENYLEMLAVPLSLIISSPQPSENTENAVNVVTKLSSKFAIRVVALVMQKIKQNEIPAEILHRFGAEMCDERIPDESHQEKLWQQILQNLRQDVDKMAYITVSQNDAKIITEQAEEVGDNCAVFFTCGHHFPRKYFMDNVLPRFTANFVGSLSSLQQTATLLTQYYTSMKPIPMACPNCVRGHIAQAVK